MTLAAVMTLAAAAALVLLAGTMRNLTRESREERIRNDFAYDATDLSVIELGRRLTGEKPGCKPNKPSDFISRSQLELAICLLFDAGLSNHA